MAVVTYISYATVLRLEMVVWYVGVEYRDVMFMSDLFQDGRKQRRDIDGGGIPQRLSSGE